jgi:pimeloyl-ACP methyl ester carboxylesterase
MQIPKVPQIPKKLYPFESHYFDRQGLRLHYLDEGAGDPVVMVHGNPSWSFYYRNLVLALRGQFRCIVPDHIGCGLSDKPGDDQYSYTLKSRVDDLEALLDSLQIKRCTLVVHDWGGMIGMAYATRHPDRIARLVVLNTAGFRLPERKPLPWQLGLVRNTPLGALMVRGGNAFARGAAWVGCQRERMPKDVRDAYCAPYDSWKNRIATLRFVQDIPLKAGDAGYDIVTGVEEHLSRFRATPTLICWGAKDFVFDDHFLREWQRHLPEAEVHRFADAGHYVLEDASKEIIPLVQGFLAKAPVRAAS